MESAKGFQAVIAARNYDLLFEYHAGFPDEYSPIGEFPYLDERLPVALEQVAIAALKDPGLDEKTAGGLLWVVGERKYRSRELFDLLLSRPRLRGVITHTDLAGIEAPLMQRFASLKSDEEKAFVAKFLGSRRYVAALPLIEAWAAAYAYPGSGYEAIAAMETPEASKFLVEQISRYRKLDLSEAEYRTVSGLMRSIRALPIEVPVDVDRVIELTPAKKYNELAEAYIGLLGKRPSERGFAELLGYFGDPYLRHKAFEALDALYDSPAAWQALREKLKRALGEGKISQQQYDAADERYRIRLHVANERPQDPGRVAAQRDAAREQRELDEKYARKLAALRERDPEKYRVAQARVQEMKNALIEKSAAVLPEQNAVLAGQHEKRAHMLRFVERKPADAAREMAKAGELYQRAGRKDAYERSLWLADLHRFDLRDSRGALELYKAAVVESAQAQQKSLPDGGFGAIRTWLGHEIRYLETGQAFAGVPGEDEVVAMTEFMSAASLWSGIDSMDRKATGGWGFVRSADDLVKLDQLPGGQLALMAGLAALRAEPGADAALKFMESRDPARYLSTVILAAENYGSWGRFSDFMTGKGPRQPGLIEASRRFERKYHVKFVTPTDRAAASPDGVWALLLKALREGNQALLLSCFTERAMKDAAALVTKVPKESWGTYGMSLLGIDPVGDAGTTRTFVVARMRPGNEVKITFENAAGGWKISDTGVLARMVEESKR